MVKITQTDFIDFISRSGTSKLSKVRTLFTRPDYHPSLDFYKPLREEIVENLKLQKAKKELFDFLDELKTSKKYSRYLPLIDGYTKFLGRKKAQWFEPPSTVWKYKELQIKMNPELGICFGDERYIIKLYFKDTSLQRKDIKVLLWMMDQTLCTGIFQGYRSALLDVERSKLHYSNAKEQTLNALLEGEAESFLRMWQSFEQKSA